MNNTIGITAKSQFERLAFDVIKDVLGQHLRLEMRDRAGFRTWQIRGITQNEDVRLLFRLQCLAIGRNEVKLICKAGASHRDVAGVYGHRHQQVVTNFLSVRGDNFVSVVVDRTGVEIGNDFSSLFGNEGTQNSCSAPVW